MTERNDDGGTVMKGFFGGAIRRKRGTKKTEGLVIGGSKVDRFN